jgi:RND family efflux transporter MFP subunit
MFGRGGKPAEGEKGAKQSPTVTVVVPGRQTVDRVVSATGNLAARREMPVGVAGEGGMVSAVLVEPGQWVGAGQVLATIDRRVQSQQSASLGAQIAVAEADARLAQSELERAQALVARGFISKADIDRKTATRDSARARVNVARAQFQQSQASNSRLDIRAPAAGLILERKVEPGQIVSGGSGMLFRMAKGGEIELLARLGESDLARMTIGQTAIITPVGSAQGFNGQIWQVAPVIDPQSRQGIARIAIPYDKALRPGGFASAKIVSGVADVPLLPESAVQSDTKGNFVYIVGKGNKVERREVQVGDVNDQGVTILGGLSGQEAVVLSAGAFLNPGETIIPQRAKSPS